MESVKIIKREKLWQEKYFDIRSYEIDEAKKKKTDIICLFEEKKMTIPLKEIDKRKLLLNKTPLQSKVNLEQTYLLYSFLFVPDKELTEDEKWQKFSRDYL